MKLREIVKAVTPARWRDEPGYLLAGTTLPVVAPPKAPNKQQSYPGYRTQKQSSKTPMRRSDSQLANTDLLSFRTGRDTPTIIRNLVQASPDLSAAVATYLRVGIPKTYTVVGRNMDGSINPEATNLAMQLLRRFTYVPDYSLGYNSTGSVQSLSESLAKQLLTYGALCGEVVLDKSRLPTSIAPIHSPSIEFTEDDKGVRPTQKIGGDSINLDFPTFIYEAADQDLLDAYARSYLESAIQPTLADADFTNDLRRVLKRAVHPRVMASIVEETVKKNMSPDILGDPEAYAAAMNAIRESIQTVVNGLAPEDALVSFDSVEYSYMQGQAQDLGGLFEAVQNLLNAKLATGAKTMPAVLGHSSGSNAASAETMLYLKHAELVPRKLNSFYSRALTVSVRLFGLDVYIDFQYACLDLRPEGELEAYKSMERSGILDLWSLGVYTDEEACIRLTGQLPPPGMPKLSGTMFRPQAGAPPIENPESGTSVMNKTLQPNTPAKPKGSPLKANVIPLTGA